MNWCAHALFFIVAYGVVRRLAAGAHMPKSAVRAVAFSCVPMPNGFFVGVPELYLV